MKEVLKIARAVINSLRNRRGTKKSKGKPKKSRH